ncbi:NAD(P)-binding protein [Athelia psychrophila]|uniref:NAD(P)-binding protein n=1 Tax=Athelia psychrophila TaxID=1759441 RepID=A0A166N133_9AGAM|nr:NAD(P)-binding protein [Fibularhizoctonia sp. CBS 109695]
MAIKPINTCVLGVGLSGLTFHVPFILGLPDLFTLHSVLERNPQSAGGKVQDRFGATPKIHRTLDDVLADPEVELIIIGTPNSTHYSFAKAALEAGKHVLVDKPVTATVAEAEELGALAKSKSLVIYGFQNRRWDADYLALRKLLALPESSPQSIGAVTEFESVFDRFRPALKGTWKDDPLPGAGATYDLGAHLLDQALQLFGRPDKLTALMQNTRGIGHPDVEDTFTVILHYPAGAARPHPLLATLRSHVLSVRSPQPRYIVRGAKGTLTKVGVDVQEDQLRAMAAPQDIFGAAFGREPAAQYGVLETLEGDGVTVKESTWPSEDAGSQVSLFRDLAAAIRLGTTPMVKWEESTAVIEMIELAHLSAKEGRTLEVPKK